MGQSCAAVYLYVYQTDGRGSDALIEISVGRYCAHIHREVPRLAILRDAKGKPYLQGVEDLFVSVTHSGDYCIIGVAPFAFGIDLQSHDRPHSENVAKTSERYGRLSKRFFHPNEDRYVAPAPATRFFDVWCAKESYVKYTGQGFDEHFRSINVWPPNADERVLAWCAEGAYFQLVAFRAGYTFCVCADRAITVRWIDGDGIV